MSRAQKNSHKTAIGRTKPSAPSRWLVANRYTEGVLVLDYGCGRGFDAKHYGWLSYDPYYKNDVVLYDGFYDVVVCNYVLNTLPKKKEKDILRNIRDLLNLFGRGYIAVRRNVKKAGYTSKGAYQRNVKLNLPIVHENSDFCIYQLNK